MAIEQGQTTVFKTNLLKGVENFNTGTSYVYKIALYTAAATLNADTLVYTTTGEITGTGYTAGGKVLVPTIPTSDNGVAYVSFANVTWIPASFIARGALIYNSTTNAAVAVLDFGADKTASPVIGFTVTFPAATSSSAIIRIS
jgi:hypothetical protein